MFVESVSNGFRLAWIPSRREVEVWVSRSLRGTVGGLCGFYSGAPEDDKRTPDGQDLDSVQDFGDSWRVPVEPGEGELGNVLKT